VGFPVAVSIPGRSRAGTSVPDGIRRDKQLRMRSEIWLTLACLVVTFIAAGLYLDQVAATLAGALSASRGRVVVELIVFATVAMLLVYGNLAYQLARLGYLIRRRRHRPQSGAVLDGRFDGPAVPLLILVPSYREDLRVIRQTLISAALQVQPDRRVVLLIDDNPHPNGPAEQVGLEAVRRLPDALNDMFARAAAANRSLDETLSTDTSLLGRRRWAWRLAADYDRAATVLEELADAEPVSDHTDALFVRQILRQPARSHRARAADFRRQARSGRGPAPASLRRNARRVASLFDVQVTAFERKRYLNLSHEPNKAMNLNGYIGLIGGRWREVAHGAGLRLVSAGADEPADLEVPDVGYVVTLDADSLLLPAYLPRLLTLMESPGNEDVAVAQTPYSAVPGARSALEQMAGATTDMQYIVHQGFTHHGATYWVGANAIIRKRALDDIVTHDTERGFPIRRYIQDRTVIEDTESTVDLVRRGWKLINYPERLSFSATPPDFGSLVIQRRRWANGGLIIMPKLLRHLSASVRARRPAFAEGFLRSHYLMSIAATNIGLLLLLGYPFSDAVASVWLPLAALPYFVLYARDLRQAGYRMVDLLRVYALNLLLLPVNLGGVAKSIHQAVTGQKIPFGRTPKVQGRTAAPALYLLAPLALATFWLTGSVSDAIAGRTMHSVFAGANAALLVYALWRFVGWRALVADLRLQLRVSLPPPPRS
jgi:cellulose synthase (UDP-forming)